MIRYSVYCTIEQTQKAETLGAPIEILTAYPEFNKLPHIKCDDGCIRPFIIPTTQQMIGWLKTKGFKFKFEDTDSGMTFSLSFGDALLAPATVVYSGNGAEHEAINIALNRLEKEN